MLALGFGSDERAIARGDSHGDPAPLEVVLVFAGPSLFFLGLTTFAGRGGSSMRSPST
jgi:hypothetical protein